jgi:hypothetical protein
VEDMFRAEDGQHMIVPHAIMMSEIVTKQANSQRNDVQSLC